MASFMRYVRSTGLFIRGDATLKGYEGWIALSSLSWRPSPGGGPFKVDRVVRVTKPRDCASAALRDEFFHGKPAFVAIHDLTSPPLIARVVKLALVGTVIAETGWRDGEEAWTLEAAEATRTP